MASEIVQAQETQPVIQSQNVNSTARGSENIAKVLGGIAERSFQKAGDFANEASKAHLLQTHGMIQDVESQSKIDIFKSPEHAEAIARNAKGTIDKIKSSASLNRADKLNLDSMADSTLRSLTLTAAEKSISLSREQAKYAALSSIGDTIQSIRKDLFLDPEKADALINAQYESLAGQVKGGIITAVEAANIHKQLTSELELAHELVAGIKAGSLNASDLSTEYATNPGQVPLSNAHLPISHDTAMNADHYFGQLTLHDIQARMANGERVSPRDLTSIKKITDLDKVLNYGMGAARATGDINSGESWISLKQKLDNLKKKEKLSVREEGYKNRLNNFFINSEQPGHYQNYIAGMPEGARAYQDYAQSQAAIDQDVAFGSEQQVAVQKHMRSVDNLNNLISKSAAIGIGMHYPDSLRQPIPLQYLNPIVSSFNKGGDIQGAINNIKMLNPKNRMYAMNAFPKDYRKQLTVYEIGNLGDNAPSGFLESLLESQQVDALGDKSGRKDSQDKFLQLDQSKEGYSDHKLTAKIMPKIAEITTYLSKQANGGQLVSAKVDQALRYVKSEAQKHNDYAFAHVDDYINTYKTNMDTAYGVSTGFNYVMDSYNVPLEDNQKLMLASHGLNEVRNKMLEYRTEKQVDDFFTSTPPIMVSSPGGRITVVTPEGHAVPDKYGHPAYSEIYNEGVWRAAEHDINAGREAEFNKNKSVLFYLRAKPDSVRPVAEGNINLEDRPKVWNKDGGYSTVKTITAEFDGKTVLLPTIINGKEVTPKEAKEHYVKTGEHLGIFKNQNDADKYDEQLHKRMGWLGDLNKWDKK